MTADQFLEDFQDLLQRDDPLTLEHRLDTLEEWDSMSVMAVIAYLDKRFGIQTTFDSYKGLQTVDDIFSLLNSPSP